jgi:sigma-B regulation protein RsbU (phosphoserine phosphatase)
MGKPLRVLIVEDSEDDTLLIVDELRQGGYDVLAERVETVGAMRASLEKDRWDVILCDHYLPRFSDLAALRLAQESGLDLPFIVLSGKISEEAAVDILKAGAHDFISKDRMARFIPALNRELGEARGRRALRRMVLDLQKSESVMERLNAHLGILATSMPIVLYTYSRRAGGDYGITFLSENVAAVTGFEPERFTERPSFWMERIHPGDLP